MWINKWNMIDLAVLYALLSGSDVVWVMWTVPPMKSAWIFLKLQKAYEYEPMKSAWIFLKLQKAYEYEPKILLISETVPLWTKVQVYCSSFGKDDMITCTIFPELEYLLHFRETAWMFVILEWTEENIWACSVHILIFPNWWNKKKEYLLQTFILS